jgi:hypothetical protein
VSTRGELPVTDWSQLIFAHGSRACSPTRKNA